MPKSPPGDVEAIGSSQSSSASAESEVSASQILQEVEAFVSQYGLTKKLELFQKAALLSPDGVDEEEIPGLTQEERGALKRESTHRWNQSKTLYFTILICALGAIEQGWAQTAMNGANPYIADAFHLGINHGTVGYTLLGWINSGIYLGNAFGGAW